MKLTRKQNRFRFFSILDLFVCGLGLNFEARRTSQKFVPFILIYLMTNY